MERGGGFATLTVVQHHKFRRTSKIWGNFKIVPIFIVFQIFPESLNPKFLSLALEFWKSQCNGMFALTLLVMSYGNLVPKILLALYEDIIYLNDLLNQLLLKFHFSPNFAGFS